MKAIGFNQGQYGDLCMNLIACRAFKRDHPNSQLYFGINKKYESLKYIFFNNDYVDHIHIWDQYDGWPSQEDKQFLSTMNFDKVFNPMPKHTEELWHVNRHQTQEVCLMHGLKPPEDLSIKLNKYFEVKRNTNMVAVNLSAETRSQDKTPSLEKSIEIVNLLTKLGYKPVQIGLPDQPQIAEKRFIGEFFETIRFVLSCDFLITVDSAMAWISSGYQFPTLGLYSSAYYPMTYTSKNWQPINNNAIYLEDKKIDNISLDLIKVAIDNII